jgi:amino acid adenylation domain-containing protein
VSGPGRNIAELSRQEQALLFERLRARRVAAEGAGGCIGRRDRAADPPPLSFAQQRLWLLDRLMPGDPVYNVSTLVRIEGSLDPAALAGALAAVVARHEALRTTFGVTDGVPVQLIAPRLDLAVPLVDLAGVDPAEGDRLAYAASRRPFDLAAGPLLRALLVRLAAGHHLLLLDLHHVVADGWSMGVLVREIAALYGPAPRPLPELPIQYADFAVWQRRWLQGAVLAEQLGYWRQALAAAPAVLALPTDRPRRSPRTSAGALVPVRLPGAAALKALALAVGGTPFIVLLAAFQAVLARWSGEDDLSVGTPVANRNRTETEGLIGFFVNTLVLRGDLSGDPDFRTLLARARQVALGAYSHQDLPFEKLVAELAPERDPSRTALFQTMFVLQNAPGAEPRLGDLRLASVPGGNSTVKVDLTLGLEESGGAFAGGLAYATDLFDAPTVARFAGHFATLFGAALADPARRLSALPLLSAAERAQLLAEWNDTARPAPAPDLVHRRFARRAALHPDRLALACEESGLTYGELDARAARLAARLRAHGVGPEVRVALAVERSLELVVGLFAVLKAGGAYVPLDPALPAARRAALLAAAGASVLLAREPLAEEPEACRAVLVEDTEERSGVERSRDPMPLLPESAAYVLFTSGSTGEPKGVIVEHRQLLHYVDAIAEHLGRHLPADASYALASTPLADLGHTVLFPSLLTGGCLQVIAPERAADPQAFAEQAERRPVDCLKIVPSHLAALLQAPRPERALPRALLVLGGEAPPPELVARVAGLAPGCRVLNHYGPAETTVGVAVQPLAAPPAAARVPLGRPLAGTRLHLLGRDGGPVAIGVAGEIHAGGPGLARGYLNRPDTTAERFVPDPFAAAPGERLYRTGDLARRLPDGRLEFLGRADRQVKVRGFRVEPGEVEAALGRHPGVAACAVVPAAGAGGGTVLAAFVAPAAPDLAVAALQAWLAERLPPYMLPARFALLAALPLTANGKVDRRRLSSLAAAAAPEGTGPATAPYAPPRTEIERTLAGIWAEVLGLTRVGLHDNFFDLGGHSLLLALAQARLCERLGRELPLLKMFEHPTVGALAAYLEQGGEAALASTASRERAERHRQGLELQRQRLAARRTR